MRIFVYKMTCDNGGAPCPYNGLLTLAICKPKIRQSASTGDLIIGFGSKKQELAERLIYIARVTERICWYKYAHKYRGRPDCIYELHGDTFRIKRRSRFHSDGTQIDRDLGKKREGHVLLSHDFKYLGKSGNCEYKQSCPQIRCMVERMKRGHCVNHDKRLFQKLVDLKTRIWRKYRGKKKIGTASCPDRSKVCNRDAGSTSCPQRE